MFFVLYTNTTSLKREVPSSPTTKTYIFLSNKGFAPAPMSARNVRYLLDGFPSLNLKEIGRNTWQNKILRKGGLTLLSITRRFFQLTLSL